MSAILDWITLHPTGIALAAVIMSVAGYLVTRNTAQRISDNPDDTNAWIMFCQGLHGGTDQESHDVGGASDDVGGGD